MASIITCDRVHDHCILIRATAFKYSTWWSFKGNGEHLTDPIDYLCRVCETEIASQMKKTISVVEKKRLSLRISSLGWSSQDQHGQYHNGWSCTRSLHLYSSHCVQVFNVMEWPENLWESLWPGRYPVLRVRYRHFFSGEKVHPVWSRLKVFHFEYQI